jgi:hypothetical protein
MGRPLVVEVLVVVEVVALLVAAVLPLVRSPKKRVSCATEAAAVRSAIARYQVWVGHENPKSLYTLVGLGLLKVAPDPDGPSARAGFVYDPTQGTYSGGTCSG